MLRARLDRPLAALSRRQSHPDVVSEVVERANVEGWLPELVAAARDTRPGDPTLAAAAGELGMGIAGVDEALTGVVRRNPSVESLKWRTQLAKIEPRICRVEAGTGGRDGATTTGFLIGADAVLTAYHPLERLFGENARPSDIIFRFDYKVLGERTVSEGVVYRLAESDWLLDRSGRDDLDFVFMRLAGSPGLRPIGPNKEPAPVRRGWITVTGAGQLVPGDPLLVIDHARGERPTVAMGEVVDSDARALRYRGDGLPGSAGAPCFDANWNVVAMHHARGGRGSDLATAIRIAAIVDHIERRRKGKLIGYDSLYNYDVATGDHDPAPRT